MIVFYYLVNFLNSNEKRKKARNNLRSLIRFIISADLNKRRLFFIESKIIISSCFAFEESEVRFDRNEFSNSFGGAPSNLILESMEDYVYINRLNPWQV